MPITTPTNPASITLEVTWQNFEGAEKMDVVSSTVTVFHRDAAGLRVVDLAATSLVQDAGTSTWKLAWVSPPLPVAGNYVVEYRGTDADGAVGVQREDLTVVALAAQVDEVLDCLLGRQKLDATTNRWIIFRRNGTILKQFDLKNDVGSPTHEDVFDRIPI